MIRVFFYSLKIFMAVKRLFKLDIYFFYLIRDLRFILCFFNIGFKKLLGFFIVIIFFFEM